MNNRGATLLGVISGAVIIGVLAALVVLLAPNNNPALKAKKAKADIRSYRNALDLYALDNSDEYPMRLEDIFANRRCPREIEPDPWKKPYIYYPPTDSSKGDYVLFSAGPDGTPGNDDDITSPTPIEVATK